MGFQYFKAWFDDGDYRTGTADYVYYHNFAQVARAAIEAAQDGKLQAALELQAQAHSLLPQMERNLNPDGANRTLEKRMNAAIEAAKRRSE